MFSIKVLAIFLCISTQSLADLSNPVLLNYTSPSVLKVSNKYYMVTNDVSGHNKIPIYSSTDLQSWKFENFVFDSENFPTWAATPDENIWTPEMHYIQGSYNLYFTTNSKESGVSAVGVAKGASPLGPFEDLGHPLFEDVAGMGVLYPNVAHDGKYVFTFNLTYIMY